MGCPDGQCHECRAAVRRLQRLLDRFFPVFGLEEATDGATEAAWNPAPALPRVPWRQAVARITIEMAALRQKPETLHRDIERAGLALLEEIEAHYPGSDVD